MNYEHCSEWHEKSVNQSFPLDSECGSGRKKLSPGHFIASCNINRVMDAAVTTLERFITSD